MKQFNLWWTEARTSEPEPADAFALATVDADGTPDVRMLLCKGADPRGFVFYTNLGSKKAQDLAVTPKAAMAFHWKTLKRQVRVVGEIDKVSDEEADLYFASRGRGAQLGAWASKQSQPIPEAFALERRLALLASKFAFGRVPRPNFWSGYRLVPKQVEFWEDVPHRLHRRLRWRRNDGQWHCTALYP